MGQFFRYSWDHMKESQKFENLGGVTYGYTAVLKTLHTVTTYNLCKTGQFDRSTLKCCQSLEQKIC